MRWRQRKRLLIGVRTADRYRLNRTSSTLITIQSCHESSLTVQPYINKFSRILQLTFSPSSPFSPSNFITYYSFWDFIKLSSLLMTYELVAIFPCMFQFGLVIMCFFSDHNESLYFESLRNFFGVVKFFLYIRIFFQLSSKLSLLTWLNTNIQVRNWMCGWRYMVKCFVNITWF